MSVVRARLRTDELMQRRRACGAAVALAVGAALVPSASSAAPPAVATERITVVHPTGVVGVDVPAVQDAVDQGGIVVLSATDANGAPRSFGFGSTIAEGSGVRVRNRDVAIVGERTPAARTTIEGGVIPIFGIGKVHLRVESIHFERPIGAAVIVIRSSGAVIVNNHIEGVVGLDLGFATEGRGIKFLGNADPAGAITGNVVVRGNVVHDLGAGLSEAFVFDEVAADVAIIDNRVEDAAGGGVLAIAQHGDMTVARNRFAPGPDPGVGAFGSGVAVYGSSGRVTIVDNSFDLENPFADGVLLWGDDDFGGRIDDASVTSNRFWLRGTEFGAVTLIDQVSRARVEQNQIFGSSAVVFEVIPSGFANVADARSNSFLGNEISRVAVTIAHVLLLDNAMNTTLRGRSGTVIDAGSQTAITGFTPMRGAAPPRHFARPR